MTLYVHLCKALCEPFHEKLARVYASKDWVLDAQIPAAASSEERRSDVYILGREKLMDALFSLADVWTIGTSVEEFVAFLSFLRDSVADRIARCDRSTELKPLKMIMSHDLGVMANARAPADKWLLRARERAAARAAARDADLLAQELKREFTDADVDRVIAAIEASEPKPPPPPPEPTESERVILTRRETKERHRERAREEQQKSYYARTSHAPPTQEPRPTQAPMSPEEAKADAERRKRTRIKAAARATAKSLFVLAEPSSFLEQLVEKKASPSPNPATPRKAAVSSPFIKIPATALSPLRGARGRAPKSGNWRGNASSWESDTAAWAVLARTARPDGAFDDEGSWFRPVISLPNEMSSPRPTLTPRVEGEPLVPPGTPFSQSRRHVVTPVSPRTRQYLTPTHQPASPVLPSQTSRRNVTSFHAWSADRWEHPQALAQSLRPLVISSAGVGKLNGILDEQD